MLIPMEFPPTYERRVTSADEGSDWLYVDPTTRQSHRVEIDVVPDRAVKIRIQYLDRDMRGKGEWVPIGRVKVPWDLREAYEATVAMWRAAERHRPPAAEREIALLLFDTYLPERIAEIYYTGVDGVLVIHDIAELSSLTGISADELAAHPDSFTDGDLHVPWPTTLAVLRALCRRSPRPALELLAQRRADAERFAQKVERDGDPWWVQEARTGDRWAKRLKQWGDLEEDSVTFLAWLVSDEPPTLADDYLTLRRMYLDLVRVVPDAIERIRMVPAQRSARIADELQALISRPLPPSAQVLGAEVPPTDN